MKAQTNLKARGVLYNHTETTSRDTEKALDRLREWYRRNYGMRGVRKKCT